MCDQPFLFLHDVGLTFGRANFFNGAGTGSVNLEEWTKTPIWKDRGACIGHLSKSKTGTLGNPHISEAGRKFLADLLVQLTDRQLRDLFEVAQVARRTSSDNRRASTTGSPRSIRNATRSSPTIALTDCFLPASGHRREYPSRQCERELVAL
jgi:hypothetical protein